MFHVEQFGVSPAIPNARREVQSRVLEMFHVKHGEMLVSRC